jgi:glutaminyl-tRNA synthetase
MSEEITKTDAAATEEKPASKDFIRSMIEQEISDGTWGGRVVTRFPPEPNGYLHIGHAKAFNLNFSLAQEYNGHCNLRFDDTNPVKEEDEYVESIKEDIKWMGFDWGEHLYFASDYFDQMYEWALQLIKDGKAYVDDETAEEISRGRGSLTEPGVESPFRNRSVEENLDLFDRMRKGEFPDGTRVLRAKVDMASPNLNMRDPVMYRILHADHHRQGDKWCVYPMYDWAHGLEDSIENVTNSLCSLEFENHRPLYNWFLDQLGIYHPQQREFSRLNLTNTVMSKRKLLRLVEEKCVNGWDDPRMPTISGMRRRGYSPEAIRAFLKKVGIAKTESVIDFALLEHCIREDLNKTSPRVMGVLKPLKVIIENYPEGQVEEMEAINNPGDPEAGTRMVPFSRELYIERDDFMEDPPKKFFRMTPGREVRLRYAYYIACTEVIKDENDQVVELRCTYDPESRGGQSPDGRKVKATIHWVSAQHALPVEVRLFDQLFQDKTPENVEEGQDFISNINPHSLDVLPTCYVEPTLKGAAPLSRVQFERIGYFCVDPDSTDEKLVFNRTATLRDTWAKIQKQQKK